MEGRQFSPGKLLLTSEYFVLDGALALAVPTKLGQDFFFKESRDEKSVIIWEAFHQNILWLKVEIDYSNWTILHTNFPKEARFLVQVLRKVQEMSSIKFQDGTTYFIETNLQFPANFGLGSSSTLINNLANWANIDAFLLNEMVFGGSGYDIAVAKEQSAILYKNSTPRSIEKINFEPPFINELVFIHLNQKQNSREGIELYKSKAKSQSLISEFSAITKEVYQTKDFDVFSKLMVLHEEKLAQFLGITPVKEVKFPNYGGFVKSLGAWGGDFVMASKFGDYADYFSQLNYPTFFEWNDLIH